MVNVRLANLTADAYHQQHKIHQELRVKTSLQIFHPQFPRGPRYRFGGVALPPSRPGFKQRWCGGKVLGGQPMDKADIQLGDHLWSVGKITSEKQGRNDL
jgi:hypothetical protein